MNLRTSVEINFASDTCEAPEVLIFEVRTITPTHHLHCYQVLARLQILRDIKLCSHLAVFAVSYVFAINPKSEVACGRTYVEVYILALPILRKFECAAIRACVVIDFADIRRLRVKLCFPRISYILVRGITIAIKLKQARHREILPIRIVVVGSEEVCRPLVVVLYEIKLPHAFHRKVVSRILLVKTLCFVHAFVSKEYSTTRFAILLIDVNIVPTQLALSCHASTHREQGEAAGHINYRSDFHNVFLFYCL